MTRKTIVKMGCTKGKLGDVLIIDGKIVECEREQPTPTPAIEEVIKNE